MRLKSHPYLPRITAVFLNFRLTIPIISNSPSHH